MYTKIVNYVTMTVKSWTCIKKGFLIPAADVRYTANIYRMVIGNFICNPLSAYRILPIGTNTYR